MQICLLDVPAMCVLGFIFGLFYAKRLKESNPDWWVFLVLIVTGVFWINALLSAVGTAAPWLGLLPSAEVNGWIALFTVLSYPLWFIQSGRTAMLLFGHDRTEGGVLWPFSLRETTDPFRSSGKKSRV